MTDLGGHSSGPWYTLHLLRSLTLRTHAPTHRERGPDGDRETFFPKPGSYSWPSQRCERRHLTPSLRYVPWPLARSRSQGFSTLPGGYFLSQRNRPDR